CLPDHRGAGRVGAWAAREYPRLGLWLAQRPAQYLRHGCVGPERTQTRLRPRSADGGQHGAYRMSNPIRTDAAPAPVGRYPHARRVGDLLFLSGIGPRTPGSDAIPGNEYFADGRLRRYDIAAQTHAVFANVRAVLEASGARWEDLVDVTVYLT